MDCWIVLLNYTKSNESSTFKERTNHVLNVKKDTIWQTLGLAVFMTWPKYYAKSFPSALRIRKSLSIRRQELLFSLHLFYVSVRISLSYIFAFIVIYCPVETVTIWSEVDLIQTEEAQNSDTLQYCFHIKWFVHVVVCLDCLIVFLLQHRPQMSHSQQKSDNHGRMFCAFCYHFFLCVGSFQPSCHWQQFVCFAVNSKNFYLTVKRLVVKTLLTLKWLSLTSPLNQFVVKIWCTGVIPFLLPLKLPYISSFAK